MTDFDDAFFSRMRDHLATEFDWYGMYEDNTIEGLSAAFEAATKPPRPEEPMGLGAVVEDAAGNRWIAHEPDGGMGANAYRWLQAGSIVGKMRRQYADIDAVKVLSEGVR